MRTFVHECDYGTIKYRLPTIPETTKLMNYLKQFQDTQDHMGAITWFIDNIEPYIIEISLNFEDYVINTYQDLMNYPEFLKDLITIGNNIIEKSMSFKGAEGDKKKR